MPNGCTLREILGASVDTHHMVGFSNRIPNWKELVILLLDNCHHSDFESQERCECTRRSPFCAYGSGDSLEQARRCLLGARASNLPAKPLPY
jgi:hypothetical protein